MRVSNAQGAFVRACMCMRCTCICADILHVCMHACITRRGTQGPLTSANVASLFTAIQATMKKLNASVSLQCFLSAGTHANTHAWMHTHMCNVSTQG